MTLNFFDLVYLLLVLVGIIIVLENRQERILYFISFQGLLLVAPVFQMHGFIHFHAWILVFMILVFKVTLTPYILLWSINKSDMTVHTKSRFGFLGNFFLLIAGLIACVSVVNGLDKLPDDISSISVIYVFILMYLGMITLISRHNWIALICGFIMIENGILLLTLLLHKGLPFGIEFGAFVDIALVIVAAITLQLRGDSLKQVGVNFL